MSTSMHDWFITDMGPAETAQKIRETINPLFMDKMYEGCLLLAEFMYASPFLHLEQLASMPRQSKAGAAG